MRCCSNSRTVGPSDRLTERQEALRVCFRLAGPFLSGGPTVRLSDRDAPAAIRTRDLRLRRHALAALANADRRCLKELARLVASQGLPATPRVVTTIVTTYSTGVAKDRG